MDGAFVFALLARSWPVQVPAMVSSCNIISSSLRGLGFRGKPSAAGQAKERDSKDEANEPFLSGSSSDGSLGSSSRSEQRAGEQFQAAHPTELSPGQLDVLNFGMHYK
mmetsp:Transcript_13597/g.26280  ORF Transcript_13597/g.26280 Transcript_13597/m.26280 type:complete len:108 (+) Transcript_13597:86-409(+)